MRNGPFRLAMGMSLPEIQGDLQEVAPGKYRTNAVPKPHSAFAYYVLQVTPKQGLSWIKAIGIQISTSVYGVEMRSAFESMKNRLTAVYGKCYVMDFLMQDSIWNEPRDWMQALHNGERALTAIWEPKHGSSLKDSLASVGLMASAIDTTTGYLAIEYSFENSDAADAEIAAKEDEAL